MIFSGLGMLTKAWVGYNLNLIKMIDSSSSRVFWVQFRKLELSLCWVIEAIVYCVQLSFPLEKLGAWSQQLTFPWDFAILWVQCIN